MSTPALAFFALSACLYIGANQPPPAPASRPSEPILAPPAVEFVIRPGFVQSLPLDVARTGTRPPISVLEQPGPSRPEYAIAVHSADVWIDNGNVTQPHCIVVIPYDDRPGELSATLERLHAERRNVIAELEALRQASLLGEVGEFRAAPQAWPADEPKRDKGDDGG